MKQAYEDAEVRSSGLAKTLADSESRIDQLQETIQRLFIVSKLISRNFLRIFSTKHGYMRILIRQA